MTYATNNDLCPDAKPLLGTVRSPHRRDFLRQSVLLSLVPVTAMLSHHANASVTRTTTAQTGELLHNRIHFNGATQDTLLSLQHLGEGYRAYNASLQRFHAMDSLSPFNDGGANAYGYVYGDPVNYNDPSGHRAQWAKRLTTFIKANPAESAWMGSATALGVASGALWAASTQTDDSETANTLNLVAGIFAALTAVSAMGAWVSSKNPRVSRQNRAAVTPARQGGERAGASRRAHPSPQRYEEREPGRRRGAISVINAGPAMHLGPLSPVRPQPHGHTYFDTLRQGVAPPPPYNTVVRSAMV
ncbi:hypothetical protein A9R10_21665 [Aeromonas piscicola]|nr:hypothetical protein A9R10_21665 [Aeromonas piscicola]